MRYILVRRRKQQRARYTHLYYQTTKAPASPNQQMPSHAFSPRAQAAPPPIIGLIYYKGPAAAASPNIVITLTTTIEQAAQNTLTFLHQTIEERVQYIQLYYQTTRVPVSSNQQMPNSIRLMPSYILSPRVNIILPLIVGSIYNRGLVAPTSLTSLSIIVIITIAIVKVQNPTSRSLLQTCTVGTRVYIALPPALGLKHNSSPILRSQTTEGSKTRVLPRHYRYRRFGQVYRGRPSRIVTYLSQLVSSYLYSRPPAKTRLAFNTIQVVTVNTVPIEGSIVLLKTILQNTARITTLPSYYTNAIGYTLYPLSPTEQCPSRRLAYIAQALNYDKLSYK